MCAPFEEGDRSTGLLELGRQGGQLWRTGALRVAQIDREAGLNRKMPNHFTVAAENSAWSRERCIRIVISRTQRSRGSEFDRTIRT